MINRLVRMLVLLRSRDSNYSPAQIVFTFNTGGFSPTLSMLG
jgi:hypothetical protein